MVLFICISIVNLVSIMTPKFLTCSPGVITVDPKVKSGSLGIVRYFEPITIISVLSSFSFNIFATYHARISSMAICMLDTASFVDMLNEVYNLNGSRQHKHVEFENMLSNDVTERQGVNCKNNRTRNRSLWYSTRQRSRFRFHTINQHRLFSYPMQHSSPTRAR